MARPFGSFWRRSKSKSKSKKRLELPATEVPDVVSSVKGHGYASAVQSVAVLPEGDRIVTASADGEVRMSAVADGTLLWKVCVTSLSLGGPSTSAGRGHRKRSVTVALLNAHVLVIGAGDLRLWNVENGSAIAEVGVQRTRVSALARLDERRFVAGCRDGTLLFCDSNHALGTLGIVHDVRPGDSHVACVNDISVCGKRLATASDDKTAAVWDVGTRTMIALLKGHTSEVDSVALSERMAVTGSSGAQYVCIYSAANDYALLSNISTFGSVHTGAVFSVHVLDTEHIMTVSTDNTIAFSSVESDKVLTRVQYDFDLNCVAMLSCASIAAFGTDGSAVVARLPAAFSRLLLEAIEAKGRTGALETESGSMSETGKARRDSLQAPELWRPAVNLASNPGGARVKCIEVLPDGESMVTFSEDGMLRAWSTSCGTLLWEVEAHNRAVGRRALAILGSRIAATGGYADSSVRTWNAKNGEPINSLKVSRGGVFVIARLGSWRFVLGCGNGKIVFCKHKDGGSLTMMYEVSPRDAHGAMVTDLSVCGRRLASSSVDKTAAVWDTETGSKVAILNGHTDWVLSVDISDHMVVTGSRGTPFVRVYNNARGYLCVSSFGAASWVHNDAVTSVSILDGDHVLSTSAQTFCVSGLRSDQVVTRANLGSEILACSVLPNGSVASAVSGGNGNVAILRAPEEASKFLKKFGAARNRDALAASELALMAAGICEIVRAECDAAEQVGRGFSDATNFDTCVGFLNHCLEWRKNAEKNARVSFAFHGTPINNVAPIIENSLLVPDGVHVRVQNGHRLGKGIYVSTKPELAFTYSKKTPIFGCLITTGVLRKPNASRTPEEESCDAFHGVFNDTDVYVLQSSSQVLPCLTIDSKSVVEATRLLENLVVFVEQNM